MSVFSALALPLSNPAGSPLSALADAQSTAAVKALLDFSGNVALLKANHAALTQCASSPDLDYPPCFAVQTTAIPAGDASPEAQYYLQMGVVANYIAGKIAKLCLDNFDRNGSDHANVTGNTTVAAIARAIGVYLLNIPYSQVKAQGYKAALASLLTAPIATWNNSQGMTILGSYKIPVPIQQRAPGSWSVHPAYFAFFFWDGKLSFLRYLRYDANYGFVFTDTFAHLVMTAALSCFNGPRAAVPIQSDLDSTLAAYTVQPDFSQWLPAKNAAGFAQSTATAYASLGPAPIALMQAQKAAYNPGYFNDGFEAQDPLSAWLRTAACYPEQYTAKLQAAGNQIYSAQAHATIMEALTILASFAALSTAFTALATSGFTVANGFTAASALENSPFAIPSTALKNIIVAGKAFDLPSLIENIGLDMSADPELTLTVPASAINIPAGIPTLADVSTTIGAQNVSLDSIPSDFTDSAAAAGADITASAINIIPPDVAVFDPLSGNNVAAPANYGLDISAASPASATGSDYALLGTDTSSVDNAQAAAIGASTSSTGNFNLANYVGAIAKIYVAATVASGAGSSMANHPTPGTVTRLPDGSTSTTNADGSTTITSPSGQQQTILPSGKVIAGGPAVGALLLNPVVLAAIAAIAFLALRK